MASRVKSRNIFQRFIAWIDALQQRHHSLALPYAVIKKFGDDEAGYQGALMAYYGFLSLFPLLIVGTAVLQIVTKDNAQLKHDFIMNATSYFPAIGQSLANSINTTSKSGLALVLGLLITFYGARGVANAVQHALNHVWCVPRGHRASFPKSTLRSFVIIIFAGSGLILAASLTGYAGGTSHNLFLRLLLGTAGFITLFGVFWGLFTFGSSGRKHPIANVPGALFAAIGLLILQAIGGYIVSHQLKTQTGINAQFGVVIALLFWLYLQAQVFLYAVELNTVRVNGLWPRSIDPKPPLVADIKAYALYQRRETFHPDEKLHH